MILYIAGPMRGLPELNFPAFHRAAHILRDLGHTAVNPAEFEIEGQSWLECMRRDIHLLSLCEGIVMLDGWEKSKGANVEYTLMKGLGLPVFIIKRTVEKIFKLQVMEPHE